MTSLAEVSTSSAPYFFSEEERTGVLEELNRKVDSVIRCYLKNPFLNKFILLPEKVGGCNFLIRDTLKGRDVIAIERQIEKSTKKRVFKATLLGKNTPLTVKLVLNKNQGSPHLLDTNDINIESERRMQHEHKIRCALGKKLTAAAFEGVYALPLPHEKPFLIGLIGKNYETSYSTAIKRENPLQVGREFKEMTKELKCLHSLGYVHGAIQPKRFVESSGSLYLNDFRQVKHASSMLNSSQKAPYSLENDKGFFSYLSKVWLEKIDALEDKENISQHQGSSPDADVESLKKTFLRLNKAMDIFALGVIFHERCYSYAPYPEDRKYLPIEDAKKSPLPSGLKELIHDMLKENPFDRPTANDVLRRLEQIF